MTQMVVMLSFFRFPMNDVAVLRLDTRIISSRAVRPVCLPSYDVSKEDYTVVVAGWGKVENNGKVSKALRKVRKELGGEGDC